MKELKVLKSFNISILILTVFFFLITVSYWIYLKDSFENNYKTLNRVHYLKLTDKEIDNVLFSQSLFSQPNFIEKKLKRFEREIYFLQDKPFFKSDINDNINLHLKDAINGFEKKKKLVYQIRDKRMELKKAIYLVSKIHTKDTFHLLYIQNSKFTDIYESAISDIINGNLDLLYMKNIIYRFDIENRNIFIRKSLKDISKVISLSSEIKALNFHITERELFKKISAFENVLVQKFKNDTELFNFVFYTLIIVSITLLIILSYIFIKEKNLKNKVNKLNISLQKRVEKEVTQNRSKDKLIFQQAKLASLGEMIGNIAHQWRQPLNTLAIIVQDIENAHYFEGLDDSYIESFSKDAMKQIEYMSSTIDDFRHFSKGETEGEPFSIQEAVVDSIKITEIGLKGNNIQLLKEIRNDYQIKGLKTQYIQVIINLIKNAQDILAEKRVKNPLIKIDLKIENAYSILLVSDNGGGVPITIIDRLFEPYFTTKHQSVGTGLGLYMSKTIIEKNFKGKLLIENIDDGATFKIVVPIFQENS